MTSHTMPRWVRITDDGQAAIDKEAAAGLIGEPSPAWMWYAGGVVDYREAARRRATRQTWRTRARRSLLWMVERLTE